MSKEFKLTIHMVSSLDGIIARPDNSIDWFSTTTPYEDGCTLSEEEIAAFLKTIDCYIMGSRTYEQALALSRAYGWPYGDVPTVVLTHRQLPVERPNIELYGGDVAVLVNDRLKPAYKNVWMVGGPELAGKLLRLKLADEVMVSILPIVLGEGKRFFHHVQDQYDLQLKEQKAYGNGMVELCYKVENTE